MRFLGEVDPAYQSDEKEGTNNTMSRNTAAVKMPGEEDKHSAMDVCPNNSLGTPTKND